MIAIDTPMPRICAECPCNFDYAYCNAPGYASFITIDICKERSPNCPLVEVTRCKDCRWWKHNSCEGGLIDAYMQIDPEKFYCAHGERRTDENT